MVKQKKIATELEILIAKWDAYIIKCIVYRDGLLTSQSHGTKPKTNPPVTPK